MPGPAARVGDPTAHGGVITGPGCPTVLIGSMPAARLTDLQVCPLVTPAPAPVPHASGPIAGPGVPTVLIGGMPAATIGDITVCVGPPGTIAMGCPTVLIGTGGGGSGGGGGGAAAAARSGAHAALVGEPGPEEEGPHWIDIQFVDSAGNPVTEVPFELTGIDGNKERGFLTGDGAIRRGGLPNAGQYSVKLFSLHNPKWSASSACVGDEVTLSAETLGYEDGTRAVFKIWEKDFNSTDNFVVEIESTVKGNKVEAKWKFVYEEDENEVTSSDPDAVGAGTEGTEVGEEGKIEDKTTYDDMVGDLDGAAMDEGNPRTGYSSPEFYFLVYVESSKCRSDSLEIKNRIEIELKDADGKGIANAKYAVYFDSGEVREGTLDGNGCKKIEDAPLGAWSAEFPEYERVFESREKK